MRRADLTWEPYDPAWLVEMAVASEPDLTWLHAELARCTSAVRWTCCAPRECGWYFVDPSHPNERGSTEQFVENIVLFEAGPGGRSVVLDILEEQRADGVELEF